MRGRQQNITQGRACRKQSAVMRKQSSKSSMYSTNMAKQALLDARTSTRGAFTTPEQHLLTEG